MKRVRGFSLIEVLLALCIGGIVLTAASSLLVTISRAWAERPASRDAFDAHVNGVAQFLSAILEEATLPTLNQAGDELIDLQRPVGFSESQDPLIHFYLREGAPLFFWPNGTAGRVHCFFYFDEGEGLSILWFSEFQKLEKNDEGKMELEDEDDLFKTPISLFCSEIIYCYYGEEEDNPDDIKEWHYENELEENIKGEFRTPEFIQLIFKWDEEDLERTVTLPIKRISPSGLKEEPK